MKLNRYAHMILTLFVFATSNCWAGKVYKCTANDGKVYFTDTQCPETDLYQKETIQIQSSTVERKYKRQMESKIYEKRINDYEAQKLREEAQRLYSDAGSGRRMRKSQRRALQEQARSLERQADVLLGRRQSITPTRTEQLEQKVRELEDTISRAPPPVHTTIIQPPSSQNHAIYVPSARKVCKQQGRVMNCW